MSERTTFDPEATITEGDWRKARVNPRYGSSSYWVQPKDDPEAFLALVDLVNREGVPGKFAKTAIAT